MILAISSKGEGLSSPVEERFGRTPYFVCIDLETQEVVSYQNPGAQVSGGAGPRTVQFLSDKGVDVVVAGQVGPKAWRALHGAGITVYTQKNGTVEESLNLYRQKLLTPYQP